VLVDGFFEWQTRGKEKIEYRIELSDPGPFALAGIYAIWMDPVTRELNPSFSILTTAANPLMEEIHNTKKRMPVILSPEAEKSWISPMPSDEIKGFLKPFDEEYMRANPVRPVLEEQLSLF
jgi:putative SOS response-associated peptidase YedK